jgi:hypothetical protein
MFLQLQDDPDSCSAAVVDRTMLLQLALNGNSHDVAQDVLYRQPIPADIEPAVARKLLLTAAARGHMAALKSLTSAPQIYQHINAAALEPVLLHTVGKGRAGSLVDLLILPAAQQLDSAAAETLLAAAIKCGAGDCVERLTGFLGLKAAQELSSAAIARLLTAASLGPVDDAVFCWGIQYLCNLPAAKKLARDELSRLLKPFGL